MDPRVRFGNDLIAPLRVHPGRSVVLGRDFDPGRMEGESRTDAEDMLVQGVELLAEYQDRLAAQATTAVLFVLQGMDGSGTGQHDQARHERRESARGRGAQLQTALD